MKIIPLFVLLACVTWQAFGQEEERAGPRGLLKRGPAARGKPTTTTTTPAPAEEAEYEDEEVPEEEQQEPSTEAPASSTEGKKLVGSGVRPFRSNTDLLEILKRRRAEAAEAKHRAHANSNSDSAAAAPESAEPAKSSYSKKRVNSSPAKEAVVEESAAKPTRGRFGRPATRSVQPESAEANEPAPAPPARSSRTFARRGN